MHREIIEYNSLCFYLVLLFLKRFYELLCLGITKILNQSPSHAISGPATFRRMFLAITDAWININYIFANKILVRISQSTIVPDVSVNPSSISS